jgi:nitroreductase
MIDRWLAIAVIVDAPLDYLKFGESISTKQSYMSSANLHHQQLLDSLQWRYAVKRFDSTRTIEPATWQAIEMSLLLTPSSFGLQPWRFLVIQQPEWKAKLPAISWNQTQPADCSHMILFAAMKEVTPEYVNEFMNRIASTRGVERDSLAAYEKVVLGFLQAIRGNHLAWSKNQAYIALGQLLANAAILGVDACPMEGIVTAEYDKLLGLDGSIFTTVVGCALGYRHADDKYAMAPKVRFDAHELVQYF